MFDLQSSLKKHTGKTSQPLLISLVIATTILLSVLLILMDKNKPKTSAGHAEAESAEQQGDGETDQLDEQAIGTTRHPVISG